ncbi:MAG: TSUP family transporter [Saprospiraceae bacterium]
MMAVLLIFQFSIYKAVLLALVCFGASILTFYSGFGLGTILLVVFALWFPIEQAIVMTAIVHFINNLFKLFLTHKNIDKKILLKFGLPSIIGALGGAFLLTRMTDDRSL